MGLFTIFSNCYSAKDILNDWLASDNLWLTRSKDQPFRIKQLNKRWVKSWLFGFIEICIMLRWVISHSLLLGKKGITAGDHPKVTLPEAVRPIQMCGYWSHTEMPPLSGYEMFHFLPSPSVLTDSQSHLWLSGVTAGVVRRYAGCHGMGGLDPSWQQSHSSKLRLCELWVYEHPWLCEWGGVNNLRQVNLHATFYIPIPSKHSTSSCVYPL